MGLEQEDEERIHLSLLWNHIRSAASAKAFTIYNLWGLAATKYNSLYLNCLDQDFWLFALHVFIRAF